MKKIKLSAISYLNTIPFIYGLEKHPDFLKQIELQKDIPSTCAQKLINKEVDIGIIPVAVLPKMEEYYIVSDYCIGAVNKVKTVLLLSEVPLEEIQDIYLDFHSRTSVRLCQLLAKEFWKINVNYHKAKEGFNQKIANTTAAVIIGDRTFALASQYNYSYDLSEEWMKWKKLPFVFAAWVSNRPLPKPFIEEFNQIMAYGVTHIEEAVNHFNLNILPFDQQISYLRNDISYELDSEKRKGMELFLKKIS